MCRVRNKTKTAFLDRNVVPGSANQSDSKYTPNHVHTFKHRYTYLKNIILAFST